jgi:hypothetical protein
MAYFNAMKHLLIFCFFLLFLKNNSSAQNSYSSCGPIAPLCTPGHVYPVQGVWSGITSFHFAQINRTFNDTVGYLDNSCSDSTDLVQGNTYQITIITGQTYEDYIRVWLDFNNDGAFDTTEMLFADSAIVYYHSGYITIPQTGILHTPLRLRVASDHPAFPPVNACLPVQIGQYKDFTVYMDGPDVISETVEKNSFSVFPNPFTDKAKISFIKNLNDVKNYILKIYDITGSLVKNVEYKDPSSIIIYRDYLSAGLFYFCLYDDMKYLGSGKFAVE